ncbi:MAG: septum formation initiator family protein [Candidatus Margulisiibacteriota bacterium]|jgi:cell division protein FtsB
MPSSGRRLYSKFWTYLLLFLSLYIIVIAGQTINRTRQVMAEQKAMALQLKAEEKKSVRLTRTVGIMRSDTYLENLARQKLGMVKSGEVVYKIVSSEKK